MAGASRKTKLSRYEVTMTREVEYIAVVEVEARNAEEAQQLAELVVDADNDRWCENGVIGTSAKVKRLR